MERGRRRGDQQLGSPRPHLRTAAAGSLPAAPPGAGRPTAQARRIAYTWRRCCRRATRTIAILRICALVGCAYEWGGQAAFWGPLAGVSDDECDALVTGGPDDPRWSPAERTVIEAVDELERTGSWSDADLGRARPRPRRRAADRTAHGRRLVPHDLHAVQRARAARGGLDAELAGVSPLTGPVRRPGC